MAVPCVLTVNGGSSSIKFALIEATAELRSVMRGSISGIGQPPAVFAVKNLKTGNAMARKVKAPDHTAAVTLLMDFLADKIKDNALAAVGHRVVHGGPNYWQPQRISPEMIADLHHLAPFDPEHLPEEILLTEAFHERFP